MSNEKTPTLSSAWERTVGNTRLQVLNTKQVTGLPKSAYKQKWTVLQTTGSRRQVVFGASKKYDAIDWLKKRELELKLAALES